MRGADRSAVPDTFSAIVISGDKWSTLAWTNDRDCQCAVWCFFGCDGQSTLAAGRISGNCDAVGEAGAGRLVAVVVGNGKLARLRL
jgi:hypothetical protein